MKLFILFLVLSYYVLAIQADGCAFMTLIAGPEKEFVDGAIALGRSLENVKEDDIERVLLHTTQFNLIDAQRLSADGGWKLKYIENAIKQPPGHSYKYRFDQVYNKLAIFAQIEYDSVVYLDADTLVMQNIDELCNNINVEMAAVMRGPFFNSGVLVVRPNLDMFQRLVNDINLVNPKYLGNDQGYLNTVFWDFSDCPYVDPMKEEIDDESRVLACARLPARYNGDVLIYAVNSNHWPYSPVMETYESPKIIHYTFGDIKPWDWYSYLLTPNVWYWWRTYRESFSTSNVIIYRSMVGIFVTFILCVLLFLISEPCSNFLRDKVYTPFKDSLTALCGIYFILQLLLAWISFQLSTVYFFSPELNAYLFMILMWHSMKILLFNYLPSHQKYVSFSYAVIPPLTFVILLFGVGEELSFFSRIFILSSLIAIFHWFIFWTMFIRYLVNPLYEETPPMEIKDFKAP